MKEYICIYDEDDMMYIPNPYEAQNAELIRCKDCKHYQADDDETYCETLGIFGTSPTSYCSFAKRREE